MSPRLHVLASHLSSEGNFTAWFVDRMLPSLVSGILVLLAGFLLQRAFRNHLDATTQEQNVEIEKKINQQTSELKDHVSEQARPRARKPSP